VTGDVYKAQQIKSSLELKAGLVGVVFPIRAVVQTQFLCTLQPSVGQIIVYPPSMIPNVVELKSHPGKGFMLSTVFSLTIHNTFDTNINVEFVMENPTGEAISFEIRCARFFNDTSTLITVPSVAAGQTKSLALEIIPVSKTGTFLPSEVFIGCRISRIFQLVVKPSKGSALKVPLEIICRKQDQSFLYSYLSHDGSVVQAAVVLPLNYHTPQYKTLGPARSKKSISSEKVESALEFPVLLTLHGSGIQPLNHADAHKLMPANTKDYIFGVDGYFVVAPSRFGAHNWEGVGDLSARTALSSLQRSLELSDGLLPIVDLSHGNIISGHSMGRNP
jgi:hypothetical protein